MTDTVRPPASHRSRVTTPQRAEILAQARAIVSESLDLERTLRNLARAVVPGLADWCAVDLVTPEGGIRRVVIAHEDTPLAARAEEVSRRYPPDPAAPFGVAATIRTGEPQLYREISDAMLQAVAQGPTHLSLLREMGLTSGMSVPLLTRGRTLGAISCGRVRGRAYDEDDVALVGELADHAALAVDNARLFEEAERRRRAAEAMSAIAHALAERWDVARIGTQIVESVVDLLRGSSAVLRLLQPDGSTVLVAVAGAARAGLAPGDVLPPGYGIVGHAVSEGRAVWSGNVLRDPTIQLSDPVQSIVEQSGAGAILAVPLRVKSVTIGALAVADRVERTYTDADIQLLQGFADQVAVAVDSARLDEEARRQRAETEAAEARWRFLAGAGEIVSASLEPSATLGAVARLVVPSLADCCIIDLVDEAGGVRRVATAHATDDLTELAEHLRKFPPGTNPANPVEKALATGATQLASQVTDDTLAAIARNEQHLTVMRGLRICSYLSVPLVARGRTLGVISLISNTPERRYASPDLELAEELARRIALAVDNARLYAEADHRRRRAEALAAIARVLLTSPEGAAVAARVAASVRGLVGGTTAVVYRLDDTTGDLVAVGIDGDTGPVLGDRFVVRRGLGAVGLAVREGRPITTSDLTVDPRIELDPTLQGALAVAPLRAALAVPLLVQRQVVGALLLGDRAGRTFSDEEVAIAEAFADHAALALENARLYEEAQRQRREAEVVAALAAEVNASLDVDRVLRRVAEAARDLCDADMSRIALRAPGEDAMTFKYLVGTRASGHAELRLPPGVGLAGLVMATARAYRTSDVQQDPHRHPEYHVVAQAEGSRAVLVVPILGDERVDGLIYVDRRTPRPFTEREETAGRRLADHAAIALRNARLLAGERLARSDAEVAREEVQRLQAITDVALAHLALDDLLRELLGRLRQVLRADTGAIFLLDANAPLLVLRAADGLEAGAPRAAIPVGRGLAGQIASECRSVVVDDVRTVDLANPFLVERGVRAALGAPLIFGDRVIGVVRLGARAVRAFSEADRALLELAAHRMASAIDNARLYEAERAARAEAEAANRAKDQFLAMLSHELRTPLTAMLGWTKMLQGGRLDATATTKALTTIERNVRLQTQLIEDLLDVSRIVSDKLTLDRRPVALLTVIEAALDSVRGSAQSKGVQLGFAFDADVGPVIGDPGRLQQVVWNLLTNAIKFTPARGRVDVRLERRGNDAAIVVTDTGKGIPASFLPHVFDRFRQADSSITRSHGGLGLGLAIVRHLVHLHGGAVKATSPGDGAGATFEVLLPARVGGEVMRGDTRGAAGADQTDSASALAGMRILLVEDEPDARDLFHRMLAGHGAAVVSTSSVDEALGTLAASPPDVVVSDLGLPGKDGYDLIRDVRQRERGTGRRLPAMALTAYASGDDRRRVFEAGFDIHVPKPVDPAVLIQALALLVRGDEPLPPSTSGASA